MPIYVYVANVVVTIAAAAVVYALWLANHKRLAADTVGRAEDQAARLLKDAERDAETRKKEALLEAKEKAHELLIETERQASQARQASATLEQTLVRRESALAERHNSIERLEKDLRDLRGVLRSFLTVAFNAIRRHVMQESRSMFARRSRADQFRIFPQ